MSDDLCSEQWFQELRKLSHKRTLALFEKDLTTIGLNAENSNPEENKTCLEKRFSGLTDLAMLTNRHIAHKMTKNNFKRVHIEF